MILACGLAGRVPAGPDAGAPPRELEVRHPFPKKDNPDVQRYWYYHERLPEEFHKRNNYAWAAAEIDGLEKKEYFAHSGIQNLDGFSRKVAKRIQGISPKPDFRKGKFKTLFVDYLGNVDSPNALPRWFDTEYKIMEDIAARLPDTSVAGNIRLYTNLAPCPSCRGVMEQFLALYSNVDLVVYYQWPP